MRKLSTVPWLAAAALLAMSVPAGRAAAKEATYLLRAERASQEDDLVEAVFEAGGDLEFTEEGKVRREKMSVVAQFVYHERPVETSGDAKGTLRSIRHYEKAAGAVKSGQYGYQPTLRDERRLIAVEIDGSKVTVFSPQGTLTWEELQLIDVQANSLLLDWLLPSTPVGVGSSWKLSDDLVAALLGLETLTTNDVQSVLRKVADGKAQIETSGRVKGNARGATSEMELMGKYHFDLATKRIDWFGLLIKEKRSEGHVDAGFEAVARVQMRITPGRPSADVSDAALAKLSPAPTAELAQLQYVSAAGDWQLTHERRWFVRTQGSGRASLRLLDRGDKLAQCNVSSLSSVADANKSTLEGFQKDVAHALGDRLESFVRVSQWHSEADYRVFRVVAQGKSSDVPIQWIYYLVTGKDGRQVVFAFVVEQDQLSRFEEADRKLVRTLRLTGSGSEVASKPSGDTRREAESG